MSRPVRIGFPNALYHVIARGDWREDTFEDDADRHAFLDIFAQVVEQFNSLCYAWCLMDIHYHLLIQTADANLSRGMRQLNGVYTLTSNRRRASMGLAPGGIPFWPSMACWRNLPSGARWHNHAMPNS
jgi:REP element-mobilizing transposase RayT